MLSTMRLTEVVASHDSEAHSHLVCPSLACPVEYQQYMAQRMTYCPPSGQAQWARREQLGAAFQPHQPHQAARHRPKQGTVLQCSRWPWPAAPPSSARSTCSSPSAEEERTVAGNRSEYRSPAQFTEQKSRIASKVLFGRTVIQAAIYSLLI